MFDSTSSPLPLGENEAVIPDFPNVKRAQITIKKAELLRLPPFSGQRDTARHAAKLLATPQFHPNHPTLAEGFAIITMQKGGRTVGNGNSRILLEKQGKVKLPNEIHATEWFPPNKVIAEAIYNAYDNPLTSKDRCDRGVTALKMNNFRPAKMHPLFSTGKFMGGLGYADADDGPSATVLSNEKATAVVSEWKREFEIVNELLTECDVPISGKVGKIAAHAGTVAGILLSIRKNEQKALKFWPKFFKEQSRVGESSDSHNWLWRGIDRSLTYRTKHRETCVLIRDQSLYAIEHSTVKKHFPKVKNLPKK